MIESVQKLNADVARLALFFAGLPDGEEVSWVRTEYETGIKMDTKGRNLARRGLARAKRPYLTLRGVGVRLSAPETALEIMGGQFVRIDNGVRRAERTRDILAARHLEQMGVRAKERTLMLGAFFGTIRVFAAEAKARLLSPTTA